MVWPRKTRGVYVLCMYNRDVYVHALFLLLYSCKKIDLSLHSSYPSLLIKYALISDGLKASNMFEKYFLFDL